MRFFSLIPLLLIGIGLAFSGAQGAEPAQKGDARHLEQLIAKLGSGQFEERQAAGKELDRLGESVLGALEKAAKHEDAEIRRHALDLIARIEKRIETAKILAGQRVQLIFKDKPILEAVAEVSKLTGLQVQFEGDKSQLANRKITLDTGEVSIWEALDQFCQKAGLAESGPKTAGPGNFPNGDATEARVLVMRARMIANYGISGGTQPPEPVILGECKNTKSLPTYHSGAVRIRALPPNTPLLGQSKVEGEALLALEIKPEPKLHWQEAIQVTIDKAVDDRGQNLVQGIAMLQGGMAYNPWGARMIAWSNEMVAEGAGNPKHLPVRLKLAKHSSKSIKELSGTIAAQVQTPPAPLVTVNNIMKAVGQTARGQDGSSLKVLEFGPNGKGQFKVRVQVESQMTADPFTRFNRMGLRGARRARVLPGGGVVIEESPSDEDQANLALVDAKGKKFKLVSIENDMMARGLAGLTTESTLYFKAQDGQTDPAKFVYSGPRTVVVEIPFTLKDVPLQ